MEVLLRQGNNSKVIRSARVLLPPQQGIPTLVEVVKPLVINIIGGILDEYYDSILRIFIGQDFMFITLAEESLQF